jgi:hypothetical protein
VTRPLRAGLAAATALLAACGSTPAGPSPTPAPATASPTPAPTPGPDTERVDLVGSGVGVYLLTTIPIAVLHNAARLHAATTVRVRFTVLDAAGHPREAAEGDVPFIAPGQTMAVAARVEDRGSGLRVTATVLDAQWTTAGPTPPLTVQGAAYTCGSCGPGPGYGTVAGTLRAAPGVTVSSVTLTAVCDDAQGGIVGGGTSSVSVTTLPRPVEEPVIVSAAPARCELYASPGA